MQSGSSPLLKRQMSDSIAMISSSLAALDGLHGMVTVGQFLGHVYALAEQLPNARFTINLCENRYLFMVGFCAALIREQTTLLPANKAESTMVDLKENYATSYILHDGHIIDDKTALNINTLSLSCSVRTDVPLISKQHCAAIVFTSGSTGLPTAIEKSWDVFSRSTEINIKHMLGDLESLHFEVATIPGQHMWGMETSILIPLMAAVCVSDARPFFMQDIADVLAQVELPRILVTTPVHLRAMTLSGLQFPELSLVLCATAPLATEMATQAERLFNAELKEVYGCSEAGSMACRRTAVTQNWQLFEDFNLMHLDGQMVAKAAHLSVDTVLQDNIEIVDKRHFCLQGRSHEVVKIAGKRTSIQELNRVLLSCEAVLDGVIFLPKTATVQNALGEQRAVAIVVLNEHQKKESIAVHFQRHIDPVFIPRTIFVVQQLPREASGKLSKVKLEQLYHSLLA